jgi:hypothetical protein
MNVHYTKRSINNTLENKTYLGEGEASYLNRSILYGTKAVLLHAMEALGRRGGIAPALFNLGTRWR